MRELAIAATLTLWFAVVRAAAPSQQDTTIWDGVYSSAQAERGEQLYKRHCGYCHRDNLQGDEGPALVGSRFTFQWYGRTLGDLMTAISTKMPDDAPGSLPAVTYADILGFLLKANSIPAGSSDLPAEPDALARIRFTEKPEE